MVYNSNSYSVSNPSSDCAQRKKDTCNCCQCCCPNGANNRRTYEILKKICKKIFQEYEKEQNKDTYSVFGGGNSINLRIHRSSGKHVKEGIGGDPYETDMRAKYNKSYATDKIGLKSDKDRSKDLSYPKDRDSYGEAQGKRDRKFDGEKPSKTKSTKGDLKKKTISKGEKLKVVKEKGEERRVGKRKGEGKRDEKRKGGNIRDSINDDILVGDKRRKSSVRANNYDNKQKKKTLAKKRRDDKMSRESVEGKKSRRRSDVLYKERKMHKDTEDDDEKTKPDTHGKGKANLRKQKKETSKYIDDGDKSITKKKVKNALDAIPVIDDLRGKVRRGEVLTMTQKRRGREFDDNNFPQKSKEQSRDKKQNDDIAKRHKDKFKNKTTGRNKYKKVGKTDEETAEKKNLKRYTSNVHRMDETRASDILRADMEERDLHRHRKVCPKECTCYVPCVIPSVCTCTYKC